MRVASFYCTHGNRVALEDCAFRDRKGVGRWVVCLGDIAAMGPDPGGTLDLLQYIRLSGDHGECGHRALHRPGGSTTRWSARFDRLDGGTDRTTSRQHHSCQRWSSISVIVRYLSSGSPHSNTEIIRAETELGALREAIDGSTATLLAGGHTHQLLLRRAMAHQSGQRGFDAPFHSGRPSDGSPPWAEYGIVSVEDGAIDASRCSLDLERVRAQAHYAASGRLAVQLGVRWFLRSICVERLVDPLTCRCQTGNNQPYAIGQTGAFAWSHSE